MKPISLVVAIAIVVVTGLLSLLLLRSGPAPVETHAGGSAEEAPRGPNGGVLVHDGPLALEFQIDEAGGKPRVRVHPSFGGAPLAPDRVIARVSLERPDGTVDRFELVPEADALVSREIVKEPHSFTVALDAELDGKVHHFQFPSYAMRVVMDEATRREADIGIATTGPAEIRRIVPLRGRLVPNEDLLAHIMPRFAGIAREVRKGLGDPVSRDEVLAVVESNESLHPYEVRSRIAGTVIVKDIAPGEFVPSDQEIFVIADLRTVWADLDVYRRDFAALGIGQRVRIDAGAGAEPVESKISFLSPVGSPNSQTLLARAVVPNESGLWRPGLFVSADVYASTASVPVAVRTRAVHTIGPFDVVFARYGDVFQAHPVMLGQRDREYVEIVSGLPAGVQYADENSFVLKADVGKAGASHDH